jgi:CHAT domain-containing protein
MALTQLLIVSGKIETLNRANEISETRGFQHIFAWSGFELARAYRNAGDLDSAESMASKAIAVMREVEDRNHLPLHLNLLADLETRRGNFEHADQLYSEATDVIDALLVNVTRRQLKSSLIATLSDAYVGHFELAATKFADVNKAYEIIETARGRALADTLRGEAESLTSSSDQLSIEAEREINRIQLALMHQTSRTERQSLLDQLFAQEQLLMPVSKTRSLVKSAGDRGKPVPLRTVQTSLGRDEMLLEYVLGDTQSYCLQITPTSAAVLLIPAGGKRIETLVADYLRAVRSRDSNITAGEELFKLLLAPAIEKSSMTRIVVVPDGSLHLLPFDALKAPDGKYILETHVVTYTPSATVLHLLRQRHPAERPAMSFLGIGDVIYPRPMATTSNANIDPEDDGPDFFNVNAVAFPELPGSRQEITSVADIMKGSKQLLFGPNATEASFKRLPLSEFSVIHFAVHGLGNTQFPDRAALVLGNTRASSEDGLLQVREIRDLPLRAGLVILSACDTGNGRLLGEEGIASLERAFLLAGAKAVIASLWTTDDTYTIALMRRLYEHLIDGADKGSALRQAKLDLLKQFGEEAVPLYWAGFTVTGDASTPIKD